MGTFIAQQLQGKGRIVEISGLEGSSPALERHRAFMDAIKPYPGLQVVASEGGNWKEEGGIQAMKRILKQTQDFDYVFAHNDCLAWGAYVAARQMRVKRNYKYTGVDGMATEGGGLELVRDGIFEASYLYPTKGDEVIALAMKILKHQPYERDNYLSTSIITQAKLTESFQTKTVPDLAKAKKVASLSAVAQFGQQDSEGQQEKAPPTESGGLQAPTEELYQALVKTVKDRVKEDLAKEDQTKTEDIMDPNASNESIVKSAMRFRKWQSRAAALKSQRVSDLNKVVAGLYLLEVGGLEAVARRRIYSGADLLGLIRIRDAFEKRATAAGDQRITSIVLQLGSIRKFASAQAYLAACAQVLGRNPNKIEQVQLLDRARIYALGHN
jgi:hypothetical protein